MFLIFNKIVVGWIFHRKMSQWVYIQTDFSQCVFIPGYCMLLGNDFSALSPCALRFWLNELSNLIQVKMFNRKRLYTTKLIFVHKLHFHTFSTIEQEFTFYSLVLNFIYSKTTNIQAYIESMRF